ncbi:helix-turn-helix domain-containing protein [Streptomyces inhibens]|uniref:helix-turn-helix domain-containing protein n=1 Tax=Streptomyces inhibens TaxID=2293571 RepID=UPI001EE715AF|nr:helix-turn-helix domain-containing protein [Streptomyces inhibens]UKY51541.1 winged helix-turn-helix domain-containing protein [Streptomyces inhibens]
MVSVESPGGRPEPVQVSVPPSDLPRILLVDDDPAVLRSFAMLLRHLLQHARQVLTGEQLMAQVWTGDELPSANALEAHIVQLRGKTEAGGGPRPIRTVRGVGYVLGARE